MNKKEIEKILEDAEKALSNLKEYIESKDRYIEAFNLRKPSNPVLKNNGESDWKMAVSSQIIALSEFIEYFKRLLSEL